MDKLQFGSFDNEKDNELVFDKDAGYIEPSNENETRRQLSKPLTELRDFVNNTATVTTDSSEDVIQFGMTTNRTIKYRRGPQDTWKDTASSGHLIRSYDSTTEEFVDWDQRSILQFNDVAVTDTGTATIISGLRGPQGPQGIQGLTGSVVIAGHLSSVSELEQLYPDGPDERGDMYAIGDNPSYLYAFGTFREGSEYHIEWGPIGQLSMGPQGEKGEQGKGLEILGLYSTIQELAEAHPSGEYGDVYAVGNDTYNELYVWSESGWASIGNIKGPPGEAGTGIPGGGEVNQIIAKAGIADGALKWMTIDKTYNEDTYLSDNPQSGKALAQAMNYLKSDSHPVGSVYVNNSLNDNPGTTLGFGTWQLVDRDFANTVITNSENIFTPKEVSGTNTRVTITSFRLARSGKDIRIAMTIKPKSSKFTVGTETELGTFAISELGVSAIETETIIGTSEGGGVFATFVLDNNGTLKYKSSTANINTTSSVTVDFCLVFPMANMLETACDKFYWRRAS